MAQMEYRRLGRSGLKVSVLSFGSWVTFANTSQLETAAQAAECLAAAHDAGVNFYDNAESYGHGESERVMGAAIRELGWKRHDYVVSTKLFWGLYEGPNMRNTLNRKYLSQAIVASLERFGLDFVDLVFCHRADPNTPIEETVWAMSDMVDRGQALYWGTSEWTADEIRAAWDIADRHNLHKPVMEQPQYNILTRERVEKEYARLYEDIGLGTTIWSPLASGLLTGKYLNGVPEGSRATLPGIRVAAQHADRRGLQQEGGRGEEDRRRSGRLARPVLPGLVHQEPARVNCHHRRLLGRSGSREHEGSGRDPTAHP